MANKYTAHPVPPKDKLEDLYFSHFMTQLEIGEYYGVTQKMVFEWFKKYGIKSRKAYKRNQNGSNNTQWKGKNATYAALHYRVSAHRGKPSKCDNCGTTKAKRFEWANISGDYDDVNDYIRLCASCHRTMDCKSMKRDKPQRNKRHDWDKKIKSQR